MFGCAPNLSKGVGNINSLFDVIGPVMIGPSSSHTAGAARIAYVASQLFGAPVRRVQFFLHGSFAETGKGHGTDRALVAGILGFPPGDERLPRAFEMAHLRNLEYEFYNADLGDVHPNTVSIHLYGDNNEYTEVIGSSIGGGDIVISQLNGMQVEITGQYPTLVVLHNDRPGIVATVLSILARQNINLAYMKLFRQKKGNNSVLVAETDQNISPEIISQVNEVKGVDQVRLVNRLLTEGDEN